MAATQSGGIVLAGGGKMGSALLTGWLESGVNAAEIHVVEPEAEAARRLAARGVTVVTAAAELPGAAETVIFAVKPQIMHDVVPVNGGAKRDHDWRCRSLFGPLGGCGLSAIPGGPRARRGVPSTGRRGGARGRDLWAHGVKRPGWSVQLAVGV